MVTMQEFVKAAVWLYVVDRDADCEVVWLIEYDVVPYLWVLDVPYERAVFVHLTNSPFVAAVYPDRSAQLLSRDEDECLLFATLWELER